MIFMMTPNGVRCGNRVKAQTPATVLNVAGPEIISVRWLAGRMGELLGRQPRFSGAEAETAWTSYKAKHASVVGGLSPDVKQVDLGDKGTWYRLRIVAGSKADAALLCDKLKADGGDCLLAEFNRSFDPRVVRLAES